MLKRLVFRKPIPGNRLALTQSGPYQPYNCVGNSTILIDREAVKCASAHLTLYHYLLPFVISPSFVSDMSQPSSSTSFQGLFDAALQNYEKQTGTKLVEHPLAKELETCDSPESINIVLQKQAQNFRKFRGNDGKIMKFLGSSVDVLYPLFNSPALGNIISLVVRTKSLIVVPCSSPSFYSHSHLRMLYSLASAFYLLYVPFSDSILHIPVTYKSRSWSKTLVLATTRSSLYFRPSRNSSADYVFILGSPQLRP